MFVNTKQQFLITIRRSPIVMLRNFLILECVGYAFFLGVGLLADYGAIYNEYSVAQVLNYHIAYTVFLLITQLVLTVFIFAHWYMGYYQISQDHIVMAQGILRRRKSLFPLTRIDSITHEYGVLGKFFKYGTLLLHDRLASRTMRFSYVPTPWKYAKFLMKLKKQLTDDPSPILAETPDIEKLVAQAEHEKLEFKTTMRWDMQEGRINRHLEKGILKTIAAFMNSSGGHLVVGVADGGSVVGLEHDLKSLTRQNTDGFENHFTHVFNNVIGAQYRHLVRLHFPTLGGQQLCVIQVAASRKPVYARLDNTEEFFVRTGNSTTPLTISEAASYINDRRQRVA